jgi:hypothetical protein
VTVKTKTIDPVDLFWTLSGRGPVAGHAPGIFPGKSRKGIAGLVTDAALIPDLFLRVISGPL